MVAKRFSTELDHVRANWENGWIHGGVAGGLPNHRLHRGDGLVVNFHMAKDRSDRGPSVRIAPRAGGDAHTVTGRSVQSWHGSSNKEHTVPIHFKDRFARAIGFPFLPKAI